ncbi:imm11 family protein [Vibrio proteolyticus]|uniref:Immunity MXAN-0049 protein domain-containing protein n=1 Tax=Vibrio proteolyticus NBRC 13287 TaxID=1219065 RepID=U3A704_VIBPR|nr:DUF1629 domain-containing protein [Vibrio proteolyticus]GAD69112.1 hypothetical protein VPR01S_23_00240 [Vibrio proteolyticus NBRC 13287]
MNLSIITENYFTSKVNLTPVDHRESLYSTNNYYPTSAKYPIVWEDLEGGSIKNVSPIVDSGDLSVSEEFAEKVMSFDPYGVEFYPSKLKLYDGNIEKRYLLAVNNVIDVIDESKSDIEISPRSGKKIVHSLYISEDKLKNIPLNKRVVFRVSGIETAMFFCEELFDVVAFESKFNGLRKSKFNIKDIAPKF